MTPKKKRNSRYWIYFVILINLAIISFFSFQTFASPVLISDNRLDFLNGFPSIGRGYNLFSNTLQSVCFQKIKKSRPTFDFKYDMTEITDEYLKQLTVSDKNKIQNAKLTEFIHKYYKEVETEGWGDPVELKNFLVQLQISTYYYSLDETASHMSSSAKTLLNNKQYVSFFNSCGFHYIRSIGSFSSYFTLLQFRGKRDNEKSDQDFVARLEQGLFSFTGKVTKDNKFQDEAAERGLKIFVNGVGLSKGDKLVNIIPTSMREFRVIIRNAIKLMQDQNAGLITLMEIVPWVEYPEFNIFLERAMKKEEKEKKEKAKKENKKIKLVESPGIQYLRQRRLEANSGMITEINRISNNQLEKFHIASICKRILYEKYIDVWLTAKARKHQMYDVEGTKFYNLENENNEKARITLKTFQEFFEKNPPEVFFKMNNKFLYGRKNTGALRCINEIFEKGIYTTNFRNIKSCTTALKYKQEYADPQYIQAIQFVRQYCLPKPSELIYQDLND